MSYFRFEKKANVDVGGQKVTAPGSVNMPGAGYSTVSAGAADVPGMSVHCLGCGKKLKKPCKNCPYCGNDVSKVAKNGQTTPDDENAEKEDPTETGGEASEHAHEMTVEKQASPLNSVLGGAALVGGGVLGYKGYKFMAPGMKEAKRQEIAQLVSEGKLPMSELEKVSSRRLGNPVLNIRQALKKLRGATGGFHQMVRGKK